MLLKYAGLLMFVAVGAGHLIGSRSVQSFLRKEGFEVARVQHHEGLAMSKREGANSGLQRSTKTAPYPDAQTAGSQYDYRNGPTANVATGVKDSRSNRAQGRDQGARDQHPVRGFPI